MFAQSETVQFKKPLKYWNMKPDKCIYGLHISLLSVILLNLCSVKCVARLLKNWPRLTKFSPPKLVFLSSISIISGKIRMGDVVGVKPVDRCLNSDNRILSIHWGQLKKPAVLLLRKTSRIWGPLCAWGMFCSLTIVFHRALVSRWLNFSSCRRIHHSPLNCKMYPQSTWTVYQVSSIAYY